jgi:spore maturation protein CgeB
MGTFADDRQPKLMRLLNEPAKMLPHARFLVAGAQYPKDVAWAGNVERMIHLNPSEHPAFYSSSRFTLNITRDSMAAAGYSPSVRLFEASACRAAIISDAWEGLDHFLAPGREVLLPKDEYEVADIIRNFPDDERRRIGMNARERIMAQHTASHRAVQFEEMVSACGNAEKHKHIAESAGKFSTSSVPAQRAPGRPVPLSLR